MIEQDAKIFVAGHRGLVGSAIVRKLQEKGCRNLLLRTHAELDLADQAATRAFFVREHPEYVFLAAAKVGGILANNNYPAEFIFNNLAIQTNIIHEAYCAGVKRLIFLGSSCIYPRDSPQPIKEEYLLTGPLEQTNRPYAVAKIAGIEMCWSYNRQYSTQFLAVMPTNLYGLGDNYDLANSHVIPAMIRKFHLGKLAMRGAWESIRKDEEMHGLIPNDIKKDLGLSVADLYPQSLVTNPVVRLWGTGAPRREFLYSDDLADACVFLMGLPGETFNAVLNSGSSFPPSINIGTGEDLTIAELAALVKGVIGFEGEIVFDVSKPDGTPRKLLDVSRINALGWNAKNRLRSRLEHVYRIFLSSEGVEA